MNDAGFDRNGFLRARSGSIGASDVPNVVRQTKTGYSASRAQLMALKAIELLTGEPVETYQSKAMADGLEREPLAIAAYEFVYDVEVRPPAHLGIMPHPSIEGSHASPDGLVGARGLVEVKCPQHAAHLETLWSERVERDYYVQIEWQLACSGRDWCDYVSWNPSFPPSMQLFVKRIHRDSELMTTLETEVRAFIAELNTKVAALRERYEAA